MSNKKRLSLLWRRLAESELDAFLVTNGKNIRYLTGFTGSNGILLISWGEACLFTDARYTVQAAQEVDNARVLTGDDLLRLLADSVKKEKIKRLGVESSSLTLAAYRRLEQGLCDGGTNLVETGRFVEEQRYIKDIEELDCIKRAVRIGMQAFCAVADRIKPGVREEELAVELEWQLRRHGSQGIAFETIVASGGRSAMPHGTASSKPLAVHELVVVDFGAVCKGYCSDMTRTLAVGGAGARERKAYRAVYEAQRRGIEAVRPGVKAAAVDGVVRQSIARSGYEKYFTHSTGHGLGLDVHEGPRISQKDETLLREGMVFTVEPGVYIPGLGGVRIEDVVAVTGDGCRVLSGELAKPERLAVR